MSETKTFKRNDDIILFCFSHTRYSYPNDHDYKKYCTIRDCCNAVIKLKLNPGRASTVDIFLAIKSRKMIFMNKILIRSGFISLFKFYKNYQYSHRILPKHPKFV